MRNRAKCKLCGDILESFHRFDYVHCKCHQIAITGGMEKLECSAMDWNNFLRIDDEGNEITVKVEADISSAKPEPEGVSAPSKEELLDALDEMIRNVEALPDHAKQTPINHYDYCSMMLLMSALFRSANCCCNKAIIDNNALS